MRRMATAGQAAGDRPRGAHARLPGGVEPARPRRGRRLLRRRTPSTTIAGPARVAARQRRDPRATSPSVQAAFSDLHFELVRAAHGEDFTAGEWTASMTHSGELEGLKATGPPRDQRRGRRRDPRRRRARSPTWSATTTAPRSCASWGCCRRAARGSSGRFVRAASILPRRS